MDSDLDFSFREKATDLVRTEESDIPASETTREVSVSGDESKNLTCFAQLAEGSQSEKTSEISVGLETVSVNRAPRPLSQFILEKRNVTAFNGGTDGGGDGVGDGDAELVIRSDKDGSSISAPGVSFSEKGEIPVPLKPLDVDRPSIFTSGNSVKKGEAKTPTSLDISPFHAVCARIEYPLYDADDILPFPDAVESSVTDHSVSPTVTTSSSPAVAMDALRAVSDFSSKEAVSAEEKTSTLRTDPSVERITESKPRIIVVTASADEELLVPLLCDVTRPDPPILFRRYLSLLTGKR